MELLEIKKAFFDKRTQVLEVDKQGILIRTCNTLFDADTWLKQPVRNFFHFAGDTFPYWDEWEKENWVYTGLEVEIADFHGLVDVYLEKHPSNPDNWLLFIIDHTATYRKYQETQSERNLKNIEGGRD
ncbi:MAG: hypothetical protein AB8F95_00840 [Bacteroidia bacterium]